jgi:hypothetical protein
MMRVLPNAALLFALLFASSPARADGAAVLLLGGDSHFSATVTSAALAAAAGPLREGGADVMPAAEVTRRIGGTTCAGPGCAERLRQRLRVDLLLTLALWASGADRSVPASVTVSIVSADGSVFRGVAQVQGGELRQAVAEAVGAALARQTRGPGPWLRVEGEPRGAIVAIDGTDQGVLPYEGRVGAGSRRVQVRLTGYVTDERSVTVPAAPEGPVVLEVRLARSGPALRPSVSRPQPRAAPPASSRTMRIDRPVLGPLLVGGMGALGIGVAIGALLTTECRVEDADRCLLGTVADETWVLVYGAGGVVALGAALVWHVFGGTARPTGTTVGLGPGSLYLRGAF